MANLDFPSSPTLNQIYTQNGLSYRWDGKTWVNQITSGVEFVEIEEEIDIPTNPAPNTIYYIKAV